VHSAALLPISRMNVCPSSASAHGVSTATGKNKWLDDRLLYLAIFLSDAAYYYCYYYYHNNYCHHR